MASFPYDVQRKRIACDCIKIRCISFLALVGSLTYGIASFVALIGGKLCHRFGCRLTHILGNLLCAVSLLASSWATGLSFLYLSFCLLYGIGLNFTFMPCFLIVSMYFEKRRSLAVGVVVAGTSAGFFVMGPTMQVLVDAVGWRNSLRILSGLLLASCFISILFDPNVEREVVHSVNNTALEFTEENQNLEEITSHSKRKLVDFSVWRIPGFTLPVICLAVVTFSHYSLPIHLVRYCNEIGISSQKSSYLFIGIGLATFVSRIAVGKICEFVNPVYVNQLGDICSGLVTIFITFDTSNYAVLLVMTLIYGFADGFFLTTFNVIPLNSVAPDKRPYAYAFTNMVCAVSIAVGPMFTGLIADRYSYRKAFIITGSITIAGGLIPLFLLCFKKKRRSNQLNETIIVYEKVTVL